jgi:hypothetical protein
MTPYSIPPCGCSGSRRHASRARCSGGW